VRFVGLGVVVWLPAVHGAGSMKFTNLNCSADPYLNSL
jgi:hypothetical protein